MDAEQHRLAQARLGASLIRQLRPTWRLLDPSDLDGTFPDWLRVVVPLVHAQRSASAALASLFYSRLRTEKVGSDFTPLLAGPLDPRQLAISLLVTGPVSVKSAMSSQRLADALSTAEVRSSRAAMRHALNGGRETLMLNTSQDERSIGWRRVTSGNACDFCSMLASRGGVYDADTVDFPAHDGCSCSIEPVWR